MNGDAKRRFCDHCQLHVHNLSALSDRDLSKFARRDQANRICVTYTMRRDGTMVTRRDAMIEFWLRPWRRVFVLAQASFVSIGFGAGLLVLSFLSLGPPLSYYRAIVPVIHLAGMMNGLRPREFMFLRLAGFFMAFLSMIFCVILAFCFSGPISPRMPLLGCVGVALLLAFSSLSGRCQAMRED